MLHNSTFNLHSFALLVDEIQTHSRPVIEHCYRDFLLQNHDPEEREYPDAADQIVCFRTARVNLDYSWSTVIHIIGT
jgi:hypothetical protein